MGMILSRDRIFKKEAPSEDSKKFIIVCEGARSEADYFRYFQELDSRVEVEVISPETGDNNSPTGLLEKVLRLTTIGPNGEAPKYEIVEGDEIWFVIDTDDWGDKIDELKARVADQQNMFVAQSNPCFEAWLCYHFSADRQEFVGDNSPQNWKKHLPTLTDRNFNSKTHPIHIQRALDAAKANYEELAGKPQKGSTEVFKLAEKIYELIGPKIDSALLKMTRE
jgi:hypothetical protein